MECLYEILTKILDELEELLDKLRKKFLAEELPEVFFF